MKDAKIQFLRAVAIIAVVLIHTCPSGICEVICRPFINFAVALFLFLSGYLTKDQSGNWGVFYKKRITRVLIPYIIWSIIYTLPNNPNLSKYVYNIFTTQACYTLYYIFVYIQLVILTPLLFKLAKSSWRWVGWCITPVSLLLFKYTGWYSDVAINDNLLFISSFSCPVWFIFYYMGISVRGREESICKKIKIITRLFLLSIPLQIFEGYILFEREIANCGTQLKFSALLSNILIILLVIYFLKSRFVASNLHFLKIVGSYSFGIYLIHPAVIKVAYQIPIYRKIPFVLNSVLIFSFSFLIVCVCSKTGEQKLDRWFGLQ